MPAVPPATGAIPPTPPPRYGAGALPPYAYVPGLAPHPFRHPDGHAFAGGDAPEAPGWTPGPWASDATWLHGVDLFNHGYPWEAHEVWEGMWRQAPVGHALRPMLQGLIQLAAAVVHARAGRPAPRLVQAAGRRLDEAHTAAGSALHGLCLDTTRRGVEAWQAGGDPPVLHLGRAA